MERAERRQRRLEEKGRRGERPRRGRGRGRGHKLRAPESSNCESKDQPERFICSNCGQGEDSTPIFRTGIAGLKSLCNACGLEWANKGYMEGRQNDSQEEGTDGVPVYEREINSSSKDLQAQLHLSDARGLKWQKIAAERLEENKELRTEIQCLNLKIKEITEVRVVHLEHFESRYGAEIKSLRERNIELIKSLEDWVKRHSSAMENLTQIVQLAKSNKQSIPYPASLGTGNAGRRVHETEADVCIGDQNNGHRETSKQAGNFERNGCESAAELNVDVEQRNRSKNQRQTQHSGGRGSKNAQQMHVDGSINECLLTSEKNEAGMPRGLKKAPDSGNVRPAGVSCEDVSQILFTDAERKSASALVPKELIMWLNSRTRRPTSEEMSIHKSQVLQRPWPPGEEVFYWTGIPGSLLLDRFQADTEMEKPSCNALTTVLRSVLNIEGSKRGNDMLWCLAWAECINPATLPGYAKYPHDTKRARTADDEIAIKSAKLLDNLFAMFSDGPLPRLQVSIYAREYIFHGKKLAWRRRKRFGFSAGRLDHRHSRSFTPHSIVRCEPL